MKKCPIFYVEEVKISRQLNASGFEECVRNDLPDVPIHFIMAGGFSLSHNEKPTIYDRERNV